MDFKDKDTILVKGSKSLPETKKIIKGVTDHINTDEVMKTISGNAFRDKIQSILNARNAAKLANGAKTGLKSIPLIGPLAAGALTFATTGDASAAQQAAVPGLSEADTLGPEVGSLEHKLESGQPLTEQERLLLERRK